MQSRIAVQRALFKALISAAIVTTGVQPAMAGINSAVTFDEFTFDDVNDPYGSGDVRGPAFGPGYGQPTASLSISNPAGPDPYSNLPYSFQGDVSGSAESSEGVNKARARADSRQVTVNGDRLTGMYALSGWHERIEVSGGTGAGTLTLTARLTGNVDIWGPANAQGLSGRGGASLNYVVSDQAINSDFDLFNQGMAFSCAGEEAANCDHDPTVFRDVGSTFAVFDQSQAVDQTITLTLPFEYDKPFYLYGTLEAFAYAFNVGAGADADFLHTGQITSFKAPAGSIVKLASGAYADFALPVPEPTTPLLAVAGLMAAAWLRRRSLLRGAGCE